MQHFPFGELLKKAWKTTFFNMKLWWLALFAGGGAYSGMNYDPSSSFQGTNGEQLMSSIQKIPSGIWIVIGIAVALLVLVLMFVSIVCQTGLIKGVDLANKGEKTDLWPMIKFGAKKFPHVLLLGLMMFVIVAPLLVLMLLGAWMSNLWIFIPGILLLIIVGVAMALFLFYSLYYVVLRDEKVLTAMSKSVDLFRKNWIITVVMFMIVWGISMAYMFGAMIAAFILVIPGALLVAGVAFLSKIAAIVLGVIGGIIMAVIIMALSAGYTTFLFSFYVSVFNKLEEAK